MVKNFFIFFALILGCLSGIAQTNSEKPMADFFVSTKGSDNWSGTLASPNASNTDGPFATLEQAKDAVRNLKKKASKDIVVLIRDGVYQLKETVVFDLKDSGEDNSITYAAYPNETPVFSSGKEITGWTKVTKTLSGLPKEAVGNIWAADVSDKFLTLYDDEGMLPRAQSERYMPLEGSKKNKLLFPKGTLKNWSNVEDVEILVRPTREWIVNMLPLKSIDEKKGVALTSVDATYAITKKGFWVENVLEELDKQGEWVLNTKEKKVYLWPRNNKFSIVAPTLLELIKVEGKIDFKGATDIPVRNIHFKGLTFKHGERYTLTKDDAGLQHDWDMLDKNNALVRFRGAENCSIQKSHFLHSGSGAIRVDLHGINNNISNNHIEYMGGGGILLCGYGPGTKDVNKNNTVYNNNIHHVGEIYWQSPGIFLWNSGNNQVANNLIHDTNYCGLIVSGCVIRFFKRSNRREQHRAIRWDEIGKLPKVNDLTPDDVRPYWHSKNNIIEYNEIHHVMKKLGDGNGIYIRASGAGNIIRRNYVHDLVAKTGKQSAIRTDGGQMDVLISENLIYNCRSQGMTLKLNNRFENNIIADIIPPGGTYLKLVEGPSNGATNKRNIFYSTFETCTFITEPKEGKGLVGEDSRGRVPARIKDVDSDYNIYFNKVDISIAEKRLAKSQADGVDKNSKATDPMFVDPENGDFRFKPDSPALKMGILPIDISKIGLQNQK